MLVVVVGWMLWGGCGGVVGVMCASVECVRHYRYSLLASCVLFSLLLRLHIFKFEVFHV